MSNFKKIAALLAAFLITVPVILTSCGGDGGESSDSDAKVTDPNAQYSSVAPDRDFDGATYAVAGIDPNLYTSCLIEFDFEEDQSDVIYSSIFKRNRKIEADYNIEFVSEYIGTYTETAEKFKLNTQGDDDYYAMYMMTQRESLSCVVDGLSMPAESIPYLDFSQPWYQSGMNEMFNINGIQLLCYTDTCMCSYMSTVCLFFNQQLVRDRDNITSPYDMVNDGTWTLENFYTLCSNVATDLNGDGFSVDDGDIFGICGEHDGLYASMWAGAGIRAITIEDDVFYFNAPGNEKFINVITDLAEMVQTDGFFCNSYVYFADISTSSDIQRNGGKKYFTEGNSLFYVGGLGNINALRSMEADFGVVPLPKYDEAQTEYYTRTADGWIYNVPSVSGIDLELCGTVIDALGAESANYVKPAFFDTALTYKYIRDDEREDTLKMLNIIFDNATIDLADTFLDAFSTSMWSVINAGNGNYSSTIDSLKHRVELTLHQYSEKIEDLAASIN